MSFKVDDKVRFKNDTEQVFAMKIIRLDGVVQDSKSFEYGLVVCDAFGHEIITDSKNLELVNKGEWFISPPLVLWVFYELCVQRILALSSLGN